MGGTNVRHGRGKGDLLGCDFQFQKRRGWSEGAGPGGFRAYL